MVEILSSPPLLGFQVCYFNLLNVCLFLFCPEKDTLTTAKLFRVSFWPLKNVEILLDAEEKCQ